MVNERLSARVKDVDGQVEACTTIRAILSGYPLSELAKDIAAASLCVFFVVAVALLIIGVRD
jgi:diacylglycerol kinase